MGLERLLLLIEETGLFPQDIEKHVDIYLAVVGGAALQSQALLLARDLRIALPHCRILTHCGGGKYNNQLKKAYALGARCALILEGEDAQDVIKFKLLTGSGEDKSLPLNEIKTWLQNFFN
jgi:histidyl-tRNA synthetase